VSNRLTLFMVNADGFGWTEGYYYNGATTAIDDVPPAVTSLVTARAGILTSACRIIHVRIETATPRLPFVYNFNLGAGFAGSETPPTAASEVALGITWFGGSTGYNRSFIRGIPLRVTQADSFVPDGPFTSSLNAFVNQVVQSGNWNVQGTLGSSPTRITASSGTPLTTRGFQAVLLATPPLAQGDRVRMHGFAVPGYNGLKVCTKVVTGTANTYQFGGAAPAADDTGLNAYATTISVYDSLISSSEVEGLTRRGAGRPFGLRRGRRQTTYSLR
jgi:hypothetical protein